MNHIESCTVTYEWVSAGEYRITGTAAIQVNGKRHYIDISTMSFASETQHTIGQDLDAAHRLIRWEITDAVIRGRYSERKLEL